MTKFRTYDYATGRFMQVDPMAEKMGQEIYTPYHYSFNNPVLYNDPYGNCPECWDLIVDVAVGVGDFVNGAVDAWVTDNTSITSLDGSESIGSQLMEPHSASFAAGQTFGHVVSTVQGGAEAAGGFVLAAGGGAVEISTAGLATPVAVPAIGVGAAGMTHGGNTFRNGVNHLLNTHGNSKKSTKQQHGYRIKNDKTGETEEFGISGQNLNKDGSSPRIKQKLRTKYKNSPDHSGEIIEPNLGNDRKKALDWEQGQVDDFNKKHGQPPINQKKPKPNN